MPLSDEDKAEITELLGGFLKTEAFTGALKAAADAAVKPVLTRVTGIEKARKDEADRAAAAAQEAEEAADTAGDADGGTDKLPPALRARLDKLERDAAKAAKAAETAEARAESERKARLDADLTTGLRNALAAAKIPAERMPHAEAFLRHGNRVGLDDDGNAIFRKSDGDAVTLDEGVRAWAETEEAAFYLPPVDGGGSGSTSAARRGGGGAAAKVDWDGVAGRIVDGGMAARF